MIRYKGFEHLLQSQAAACPDHTALLYEGDGEEPQTMTYARLYEEVKQRALYWKDTHRTCLGVLCDGSMDCILTIFAAVLAGMQTVLLDETASDELLQEQITSSDIDILWGDPELVSAMTPHLTAGIKTPGNGRMLFFTSGTTRQSKAVTLTDRSLCASAWNGSTMLPLSPEDRLMCMLPLHHVFGFVCSLLWGLVCGSEVAVGRGPRHYHDDPFFFHPTVLSAVPMLLQFMIRQNLLNREIRLILVGAGDCPEELLCAVTARGIRVSFGYGLTETSSGVAISVSGDPYAMEVCPDDTITIAEDDEILIQAPLCMMEGYYGLPEETSEVLRNGVFHTGDLGYFDKEGRLHLSGRKKEILVFPDGTKIYLPEYEARIMKALNYFELAVVEKDHAPALIYRGDPDERSRIQQALAPVMKQYPRSQQLKEILFTDGEIPRTATGKVKRWELLEKAVQRGDTDEPR